MCKYCFYCFFCLIKFSTMSTELSICFFVTENWHEDNISWGMIWFYELQFTMLNFSLFRPTRMSELFNLACNSNWLWKNCYFVMTWVFLHFLSNFFPTYALQRGKVPGSSMGRPTTGIAVRMFILFL